MPKMDDFQTKLTFWTVLAAIGVLFVAFLVAVFVFKDADNPGETIVAILGAITGVLGTLVGYVAGQTGKREAEARADSAEERASKSEKQLTAVVASSERGVLEQAREAYPDLFRDS